VPDFTIMLTRTCPSNYYWETEVAGSRGQKYRLSYTGMEGWECTCPGFKFRKTCKHVSDPALTSQRCGWGSDAAAGTQYDEKHCPQCGQETMVLKVAV
jgi:hypothetical protein